MSVYLLTNHQANEVFPANRGCWSVNGYESGEDLPKAHLSKIPSENRSMVNRHLGDGAGDGSYFAALSSAAEEPVRAIGLESRYANAGWHVDSLQDFSCFGIDVP